MITAELQELYAVHGTWDAVARQVGRTDRSVRPLVTVPGEAKNASPRTRLMVRAAHRRLKPFPLPHHLQLARESLNSLKAQPGSDALRDRIVELDGLLTRYQPNSALERMGRSYLLGFCAMTKALHHNDDDGWFGGADARKQASRDAERHFNDGLEVPDGDQFPEDRERIERLRFVIWNNKLAAIEAQVDVGARSRDDARDVLISHDALKSMRKFLIQNKFLWQAASNGLHLASVLRSSDRWMLFFYSKLRKIDRGFQSFDYSPGEIPAISKDKDLKFFHDRFREKLHKRL